MHDRSVLSDQCPASSEHAASPTPPIELDTAALDQILGAKGSINGGVYQVGVPRGEDLSYRATGVVGY